MRYDRQLKSSNTPWTTKEKEILVLNYAEIPKEALLEKLPRRSWGAIKFKAHILHIRKRELKSSGTGWTRKEKEELRKHYPSIPWPKLLVLLPSRTKEAIRCMAQNLGIRRNKLECHWTPEREQRLKIHYPFSSWTQLLALFPKRTKETIRKKASLLKIKRLRSKIDAQRRRRKGKMCQLRKNGLTYTAIGKRYGISRQRVHQVLGSDGETESQGV